MCLKVEAGPTRGGFSRYIGPLPGDPVNLWNVFLTQILNFGVQKQSCSAWEIFIGGPV